MCCLSPLLNPDRDDGYYEDLGLERKASGAAIRKAFRKLSLRMHPDKRAQRGETMTAEDEASFQRCKEAYECLSDPKRRKIYDSLGELGLKLHENPTSVQSEMVLKTLSKMSEGCRAAILLGVLFAVGFFFLFFPVLLSLNVDEDARVPWAVVWLPLWVVDAFLLLNHVGWVVEAFSAPPPSGPVDEELGSGAPAACDRAAGGPGSPDDDVDDDDDDAGDDAEAAAAHDDTPVAVRVFLLLQLSLVVVFQGLLVSQLDDGDAARSRWALVFAPLLVRDVLEFAASVPGSVATVTAPEDDDSSEPLDPNLSIEKELRTIDYVQRLEARDRCRRGARTTALRLALEVLLLCKLADAPAGAGKALSWWAVFSPLWVYAAINLRRSRGRTQKAAKCPNFKGSYLGRFPLVPADLSTSDHLSERSRT